MNNKKKNLSKQKRIKLENVKSDKAVRKHITEEKLDKIIMDSFPASDPPSTY